MAIDAESLLAVTAPLSSGTTLSSGKLNLMDASGGALAMTLPTPSKNGVRMAAQKIDSSANTIQVTGSVNGSTTTLTFNARYETRLFVSNGSTWTVLSHFQTSTQMLTLYQAAGAAAGGDLVGTYPNPSLKSVITARTVGSSTQIPVLTIDANGRVTATATAPVSGGGGTGTSSSFGNVPIEAGDTQWGGLTADGSITGGTGTDNYAALRAACLAAHTQKRSLHIPAGTYRVSDTIPLPENGVLIFGDGSNATTIFTTANKPAAASRNWLTEFEAAPGNRGGIRDIHFAGAGASSGLTSNHALVLRCEKTQVQNVFCSDAGGNGFHLTTLNQAGVKSYTGNLVENQFDACEGKNVGGYPFFGGELGNNLYTDGRLTGFYAIATGTSPNHVFIGSSAGWQVDDIHTYVGCTGSSIRMQGCWHTAVGKVYIESYGAGQTSPASSTAAGLELQVQSDVSVDSATIIINSAGQRAVRIYRASGFGSYNARINIASLMVRNSNYSAGTVNAVENTDATNKIVVGAWGAFGGYATNVQLMPSNPTASQMVYQSITTENASDLGVPTVSTTAPTSPTSSSVWVDAN